MTDFTKLTLTELEAEEAALDLALREAREAVSPWQPIETAPRDGSTFITYTPGGEPGEWGQSGMDFAGWDDEYQEFWKSCCGFDHVTHWMAFPKPPCARSAALETLMAIDGELL